jgi:uncharacterized protein YjbI with pentapeptide repeats
MPLLLLGLACASVLVYAVVYVLPGQTPTGLSKDQILKVQSDRRSSLMAAFVGVAATFGAYVGLKQLTVSREGQITERFTKAIDQLGSEKVDVRLGGIYALERLSSDSMVDHSPIAEILTAFIREHSKWPPTDQPTMIVDEFTGVKLWPTRDRATDVQAALTVLGRRSTVQRSMVQRLDLTFSDLRSARMVSSHFERASFRGSNLQQASLAGTFLEDAILAQADLTGALLIGAKAQSATFEGAILHSTDLYGADLQEAVFSGAICQYTQFIECGMDGVNFHQAFLDCADFSGSSLIAADFSEVNSLITYVLARMQKELDITEERGISAGQFLLAKGSRGTSFKGADLAGARFSEGELPKADFREANLEGADFREANLEGADFREANLEGADFREANLEGADWGGDNIPHPPA